jgi:hypothetical protein
MWTQLLPERAQRLPFLNTAKNIKGRKVLDQFMFNCSRQSRDSSLLTWPDRSSLFAKIN